MHMHVYRHIFLQYTSTACLHRTPFLRFRVAAILPSIHRLNARRSLREIGEEGKEIHMTNMKFMTQAISSFSVETAVRIDYFITS